jgi:hypothetical protein
MEVTMDKVSEFTGSPWTATAVEKLRELWSKGVPADMIAETLARPEHQVRAKAGELGLPQHVESA